MNAIKMALIALVFSLGLAGCNEQISERSHQSRAAQEAANSVVFQGNAEIDNIKWRLELTSKPGIVGYIMLLNDAGQPILYETVVGKVTSGSKRLTPTDRHSCEGTVCWNRASPSDEGTYGSSNPYIFYRTAAGEYRQWSGAYLYSDKPFRLRIEPLVISEAPIPEAKK